MCVVDQRNRIRQTARALDDRSDVIAVDVHPPGVGPSSQWSLECLLEDGGVPSAVLTELGSADLELLASLPIGPHWRFVCVPA